MSFIRKAQARAQGQRQPEGGDNQDLAAENDRLRRQVAERDTQIASHRRKIDELTRANDTLRITSDNERLRSALVQEAHKQGALDPEEIADLCRGRVRLDNGKIVGVEDPTQDVAGAVKSYLEKRPHHLKAPVVQGSGAGHFPGSPPAPPPQKQHDMTTQHGATGAFREAVLRSIKPTSIR